MGADHAERRGIPLAPVPTDKLKPVLPAFAAAENPIDVTGALLSDSGLFGAVLPIVGDDARADLLLCCIPVAGAGYDVPRFARDIAAFEQRYGTATAVAAPQPAVRAPFTAAGIATFASESEAMDALAQVADHAALLRQAASAVRAIRVGASRRFLNEAESLAMLAKAGIAVVEHRLCTREDEVEVGDVVLKACSHDLPHKSDHGLVALSPANPKAEFRRLRESCLALGATFEGVIVARRARGLRELALGARIDPAFGPVVLVGDGGIYLEALKDFRLLLPPFGEEEVLRKLGELRIAPLLGALRGQPARDVRAFARMAVQLGEAIVAWDGTVASVDINPVAVFETGAVALDALVEVAKYARAIIFAP
jgi:acyl-CoA synthetase (NDP forming)